MAGLRRARGAGLLFLTVGVAALTVPAVASTYGEDDTETATPQACSNSVRFDGYSDVLDKATFQGKTVNGLSALDRDASGRLHVLSDRSTLYALDVATNKPTGAVRLRDEAGKDLDSDGLVIRRDGTRLVASELEPSVRQYDPDGKPSGWLRVPDMLRTEPDGQGMENRTFEGLSMSPGERTLAASMEGWLVNDHSDIRRIQTWQQNDAGAYDVAEQYAYRAEPRYGISEIAMLDEQRLIVLERTVGDNGWGARLYLADLKHATDVGEIPSLPQNPDSTLVKKSLLADLGSCLTAPQGDSLLDNVEGMILDRPDSDGRYRLQLISDDNQTSEQVTRLYSLSVDPTR